LGDGTSIRIGENSTEIQKIFKVLYCQTPLQVRGKDRVGREREEGLGERGCEVRGGRGKVQTAAPPPV